MRDSALLETRDRGFVFECGFDVLWSRYVKAGGWDQRLSPGDNQAKEVGFFAADQSDATPAIAEDGRHGLSESAPLGDREGDDRRNQVA